MDQHANVGVRYGRWRATPLVGASIVGHVAAVGLVALRPAIWPWVLGSLVADHAVLTAAGLWPRSALLGPNWTRLSPAARARSEVALTIDDGPEPEVTPLLLDVLEQYGARATFFCIGEKVIEHPALAREIVRRGHCIENHSHRHLHRFSLLGPRGMAAEVATAQSAIIGVVGVVPRFFRAPAGLRNVFLEPVLARAGLRLASWTRRGFDTVTDRPAVVLERLTNGLAAGDILLLHDGHAARSKGGRPVVMDVLPALLEEISACGLKPVTLAGSL